VIPEPTVKLTSFDEPNEVVASTVSVCLTLAPVASTKLPLLEKDCPEKFCVPEVNSVSLSTMVSVPELSVMLALLGVEGLLL